MAYLLNVMNKTVEQPLHIDFAFRSHRKPVQTFYPANISEYRFNNRHAFAVNPPAFLSVDFAAHSFGKCIPDVRAPEQTSWSAVMMGDGLGA